jgi:hypothetical protein
MPNLKLQAGMPAVEMAGGSSFVFEAISPSDGTSVTGVTVSDVAIYGRDVTDDAGTLEQPGPFQWVPGAEQTA